jgi:predicted Zn-dependent protease with MMP-like domain
MKYKGNAMNKAEMETLLLQEAKQLPADKLAEVIDFVVFLKERQKRAAAIQKKPVALGGLWEGVNITEQDIDEARAEMWGNFPRDDF